ncbi:PLP-dependent cysteine synthase family protein [Caldibacillus debilis]|jgi:O-acetylserine dependent cystathionine beta-synthase|uniref:PLP-dependent cysteine synthase family protein n=1 Tax=Caldibacillus debilis TaxID=301148 RepID=UPI000E373551|nr:cysteine synthase family protein [Caldibacillus debilis]MBY6271061.1 cysteine synthase [Bacillaceae bacterium]REJ29941.1 MAG: cysteine synthase [Caldibacillus debilis]
MRYYHDVRELVGRTPLVKINRHPFAGKVRIFAKLEYLNPGGSVKDRLGRYLLQKALESGKIDENGTIIEPTAGNTGIGLALAAAGTNVKVICVVPEKFSIEKQELMRALGATVINTPTELGMQGAIEKAKQLLKEIPNSYCPNQFENPWNPETYYETMGPEIVEELDGKIDVFVAGAGSGGTFTGTAKYLKEKIPGIRTVIVEPQGSILNGGEPGPHKTEGIGVEKIPPFLDKSLMDAIYTIPDRSAFARVKELAKNEGLLVGSSSGAAFDAALQEAAKAKEDAVIVTVFPDSSERYLSKGIYKEEGI